MADFPWYHWLRQTKTTWDAHGLHMHVRVRMWHPYVWWLLLRRWLRF